SGQNGPFGSFAASRVPIGVLSSWRPGAWSGRFGEMRVLPFDRRTRHKASALVVAAAMVAGAGCRSDDDRQRALVIARSTTTTTALPGPMIVTEDGTIIGWRQGPGGTGVSAPGRHHPQT